MFIGEFNPSPIRYIEFASIVICVIFALVFSRKHSLLHLGLFFTIFGDLFLTLLKPANQIAGLSFFIDVQIVYFLYLLQGESKNMRKFHIISRVFFTVIAVLLASVYFEERVNALVILTAIYGPNLILNIVFSFAEFKKYKMLAIGLVFFFLCDFSILVSVSNELGFLTTSSSSPLNVFMSLKLFGKLSIDPTWLFYLPSQVLITLFAVNNSYKEIKE